MIIIVVVIVLDYSIHSFGVNPRVVLVDLILLFVFLFLQVANFISHGFLVESTRFEKTAKAYYGEMTFEEGYLRFAYINVSISIHLYPFSMYSYLHAQIYTSKRRRRHTTAK